VLLQYPESIMTKFQIATSVRGVFKRVLVRGRWTLLALLACSVAGYSQTPSLEAAAPSLPLHVTHVLGFESVPRNTRGALSVEGDTLRFERKGSSPAEIRISSISSVFTGEEDRQVGGMPMTVGKAAVPFGGGRVVSLFSHKKYDSFEVDYRDDSGGAHAAVFRLNKGEGEILKMDLVARGAQSAMASAALGSVESARGQSSTSDKWSVQVDKVDPGDTALDPCFSAAIYEGLVRDLLKSKQFESVFRSGDRNAAEGSGALVLKTRVEKYSAGSETLRAVTTVAGATKIKVHVQLVKSSGQVVAEGTVDGNIRFLGDNLKATDNVASKTAKLLRRSKLASPGASMPVVAVQQGGGQ
jgi:hypothetical protein